MTGVNPAKHGIYDFVQRVPGSVRRQVVHHNQIRANTLFQIAGQAGLNVGAVNVPLTYPPPRLNGFAVSGMLTPGPDSPFTYPPELKEELNRVAKPYILDVWWKRYMEKQAVTFVEELTECLRHRTTAIRYLIENRQWDLFVAVLTEVDRIQHSLWRYLDVEENPSLLERLENRKIHDAAIAFFHTLDVMIGSIIRSLPAEADLVIISDHGFGPMLRKFYVNSWLRNEGFLNVHVERLHSLQRRKKLRETLRKTAAFLRLQHVAGKARRIAGRQRASRMIPYDVLECIDWHSTLCYAASYSEQGIYLNVKGREPFGTVSPGPEYERERERIITTMKTLRDPSANRSLRIDIYKKEEIYAGPYLDNAPDIIFAIDDGAYLADIGLEEKIFVESNWLTGTGTHRSDGIFIAAGPDIGAYAGLPEANIIDVAPTVLHLLRLPVPNDMEGRVLADILAGELAKNPISYCEPLPRSETPNGQAYSDEEETLVRDKLRGLGYMG
jgi:predicted AlkP superfamily phosphohydrolase/phosphomutase